MKTYIYISITIAAFSLCSACKKESNGSRSPLTGIWRSTEGLADAGNGNAKWLPIAENEQVILQFNTDGRLEGTAFPNYVSYTLKDPVTVTFASEKKELQNYSFSISDGKLTISPAGPVVCYEGCATRFVKVR